jgi:hypothetical protein
MSLIELPETLYAGNSVTAGVTFTTPQAGVPQADWLPVDPTGVSLTYVPGNGQAPVTWTYPSGNIVRVTTGVYIAELDTTDLPGRWQVKWVGTGACAAVWTAGFTVTPQPF